MSRVSEAALCTRLSCSSLSLRLLLSRLKPHLHTPGLWRSFSITIARKVAREELIAFTWTTLVSNWSTARHEGKRKHWRRKAQPQKKLQCIYVYIQNVCTNYKKLQNKPHKHTKTYKQNTSTNKKLQTTTTILKESKKQLNKLTNQIKSTKHCNNLQRQLLYKKQTTSTTNLHKNWSNARHEGKRKRWIRRSLWIWCCSHSSICSGRCLVL